MQNKILIIEDDMSLGQMLLLHFEDEGFKTQHVPNCEKARIALQHSVYDLILMDQQLPDGLGIDLLSEIIQLPSEPEVIMMTGHHDLELAISAIKKGASDFIHKPVKTSDLKASVQKALLTHKQKHAVKEKPTSPNPLNISSELIGKSNAMLAVSKEIALSAQSNASILITGESGTGKELVAKLIHQHSLRSSGPFIAINCAAIVDNLLESELFGHEKGAFTGANERKLGKFELAQNGTIFLDEIGELAMSLQAKLLRALQEQTIEAVGSTSSRKIDVRIITATNKDLFQMSRDNLFREDLIYRLNVINIQMPPLRKRREDIPLLAKSLLNKAATQLNLPAPQITEDCLQQLQQHDWPGNVRELGNIMTQAILHSRGNQITAELLHLDSSESQSQNNSPTEKRSEENFLISLEELEAQHIQRILKHTNGHKSNSCKILGISRPALDRKILKYNLN